MRFLSPCVDDSASAHFQLNFYGLHDSIEHDFIIGMSPTFTIVKTNPKRLCSFFKAASYILKFFNQLPELGV